MKNTVIYRKDEWTIKETSEGWFYYGAKGDLINGPYKTKEEVDKIKEDYEKAYFDWD